MTVAIACNTPEGVILGADSALTLNDNDGKVIKTYENATKLFPLDGKPIGIATFGLGTLGNRLIGTYLSEFERQNPNNVVAGDATMGAVVEELRKFFLQNYQNTVVPQIETQTKKKFSEIPDDQKPILGLGVGGFSSGAYLSEVWQIIIPHNATPNSSLLLNAQGDFRSTWFALCEPIIRYHRGYDNNILNDLKNYFSQLRGTPFTPEENQAILELLQKREYPILVSAMPMEEAIAYVKFLVEMVINHYRFCLGSTLVGGRVQLGLVSYKGGKFRILSPSEINYDLPEGEIINQLTKGGL